MEMPMPTQLPDTLSWPAIVSWIVVHRAPFWLRDPRIADLVSDTILIGDCEGRFYRLCAWVVMPNHVHLLIRPLAPVPVLMRWLKGSTARGANRILGRTGQPFWQDESFDRYLRRSSQIERTIDN